MCFVSIYENRRMKSIVLRKGKEGKGIMMEGANLTKIDCKHIYIKMYPTVQLLYANKIIKKTPIRR
jgi:hypothetical protein